MIPELRCVSFYFVMTLCVGGLGRAGLGLSHLELWCSHRLEVSQGGSLLGAQLAEMSQRVTHVAALETGCWLRIELGLSLCILPKMPLQCVLSQCSRTSSMMSDFPQKEHLDKEWGRRHNLLWCSSGNHGTSSTILYSLKQSQALSNVRSVK